MREPDRLHKDSVLDSWRTPSRTLAAERERRLVKQFWLVVETLPPLHGKVVVATHDI